MLAIRLYIFLRASARFHAVTLIHPFAAVQISLHVSLFSIWLLSVTRCYRRYHSAERWRAERRRMAGAPLLESAIVDAMSEAFRRRHAFDARALRYKQRATSVMRHVVEARRFTTRGVMS